MSIKLSKLLIKITEERKLKTYFFPHRLWTLGKERRTCGIKIGLADNAETSVIAQE